MAKVALLGRPGEWEFKPCIIDMGKGWGDNKYSIPPVFWVIEYQYPKHPRTGRQSGLGWSTRVGYQFFRRLSDGTLLYKRPGYRVGSL